MSQIFPNVHFVNVLCSFTQSNCAVFDVLWHVIYAHKEHNWIQHCPLWYLCCYWGCVRVFSLFYNFMCSVWQKASKPLESIKPDNIEFSRRHEWDTLSNALAKFMITRYVWISLSCCCARSWVKANNWDSHVVVCHRVESGILDGVWYSLLLYNMFHHFTAYGHEWNRDIIACLVSQSFLICNSNISFFPAS